MNDRDTLNAETHGPKFLLRSPDEEPSDAKQNNVPFLAYALQLAAILAVSPPVASAADSPIRHRLAFFEYGNCPNRFVELDAEAALSASSGRGASPSSFRCCPTAHLSTPTAGKPTGVVEIDARGETVWNYVSHCPQVLGLRAVGQRQHAGRRTGALPGGRGRPRRRKWSTSRTCSRTRPPITCRSAICINSKNGDILAAHEGDGAIREYSPSGKIVWEYTGVENTGDARRLTNGNTLIAGGTQKAPDRSLTRRQNRLGVHGGRRAAAQHRLGVEHSDLKNGNYLVGNFLRGHEGQGAHAFEVTRDKKVVWTFADHKRFKSVTTVRAIEDE